MKSRHALAATSLSTMLLLATAGPAVAGPLAGSSLTVAPEISVALLAQTGKTRGNGGAKKGNTGRSNGDAQRRAQERQRAADQARQRDAARRAADQAKQRDAARRAADQAKQRDAARRAADQAKQRDAARRAADQARQRDAARRTADQARQRDATRRKMRDQARQRALDNQRRDAARRATDLARQRAQQRSRADDLRRRTGETRRRGLDRPAATERWRRGQDRLRPVVVRSQPTRKLRTPSPGGADPFFVRVRPPRKAGAVPGSSTPSAPQGPRRIDITVDTTRRPKLNTTPRPTPRPIRRPAVGPGFDIGIGQPRSNDPPRFDRPVVGNAPKVSLGPREWKKWFNGGGGGGGGVWSEPGSGVGGGRGPGHGPGQGRGHGYGGRRGHGYGYGYDHGYGRWHGHHDAWRGHWRHYRLRWATCSIDYGWHWWRWCRWCGARSCRCAWAGSLLWSDLAYRPSYGFDIGPAYGPYYEPVSWYDTSSGTTVGPLPLAAPSIDDAWSRLGERRFEDAHVAFTTLVGADASNAEALVGVAISATMLERAIPAIIAMRQALRLDPRALNRVPAGDALDEVIAEALAVYGLRIREDRADSDALLMTAALRLLVGDVSGAYFAIDADIDTGDASLEAESLRAMLEDGLYERF